MLPRAGEFPPEQALAYLCNGCRERRPEAPIDALAEQLIEEVQMAVEKLALTPKEQTAILARLSRRLAPLALVD